MTSPVVDGNAIGNNSSSTTVTATLTTSNANDVLFACLVGTDATLIPTISGPPTGGANLTWYKQFSLSGTTAGQNMHVILEVWAASTAISGIQSGVTFTGHYSAAYGHEAIVLFGVSGTISPNTPFDLGSFPVNKNFQTANSDNTLPGITTLNPDDLLIAFSGTADSGVPTVPSGFAQIAHATDAGAPTAFGAVTAWSMSVSSLQVANVVTVHTRAAGAIMAVTADAPGRILSGCGTIPLPT